MLSESTHAVNTLEWPWNTTPDLGAEDPPLPCDRGVDMRPCGVESYQSYFIIVERVVEWVRGYRLQEGHTDQMSMWPQGTPRRLGWL